MGSTAAVTSVFGEPIHANGKTVVPFIDPGRLVMAFAAGALPGALILWRRGT